MKSPSEIIAGRSDGVGNARGWVESRSRFHGEETKKVVNRRQMVATAVSVLLLGRRVIVALNSAEHRVSLAS